MLIVDLAESLVVIDSQCMAVVLVDFTSLFCTASAREACHAAAFKLVLFAFITISISILFIRPRRTIRERKVHSSLIALRCFFLCEMLIDCAGPSGTATIQHKVYCGCLRIRAEALPLLAEKPDIPFHLDCLPLAPHIDCTQRRADRMVSIPALIRIISDLDVCFSHIHRTAIHSDYTRAMRCDRCLSIDCDLCTSTRRIDTSDASPGRFIQ